ncbi:MAG: magnesium-translocating P-type ATPase [Bacteroidia bacterium]
MNSTINNFWSLSFEEVLGKLNSTVNGLSETEAEKRLSESPHVKKETSSFLADVKLFLSQFKSPLVLLLVIAVILSAFLGASSDVVIIVFILLATGSMSFWQERNAGRAVEKLRSIIKVTISVLRDGKQISLDSDKIVPGDILLFSAGDIIPADCLLLEEKDLHTNESSLTGESFPSEKLIGKSEAGTPVSQRKNVLYQGTSVVSGTAKAVVVTVGKETEFGRISASLTAPPTETAFEKGIRSFGFLLMQITIVLSIIILGVNIYFGRPIIDSLLFALALTVGMAPELLPAIMTIAMASGAKRMAERKVIVKKLSSIQNLGEVNLLCSDKTGTLTEGVIKVSGAKDADNSDSEKVKLLAYLNAIFETGFANPLDEAIRGLENISVTGFSKLDEIPYDFLRKRLSIEVKNEKEKLLITKGALSNVLEVCTSVEVNGKTEPLSGYTKKINDLFIIYSSEGFRTIGVCYKTILHDKPVNKNEESEMTFAGFILLYDPPKEGIIETINELRSKGVSLKLITGDNKLVAGFIGKKIGLDKINVLSGSEIHQMTGEAFTKRISETDLFAEIEPQQKEQIVRALQKAGFVVAYLGDGINDVSAIHTADVGITTNNAVDVAKEAADVVLLEKNLSVIVDGIMEGRRTFINTLKYIFINTSATFGNMFSMAGASLLLPFLPMLPKQILMTNFLTDFPYMAVANDNVDEERLLKPQKWNTKMIRNFMLVFGFQSSIFDFLTFYLFYFYFKVSEETFRTSWFLESIFTELIILFIVRTHKTFFTSKPGKWLLILSLISFVLTISLPYLPFAELLSLTPLPPKILLLIIGITALYAVMSEFAKRRLFRKMV